MINRPFDIKAVLFDFDGTLTKPGALDFPLLKKTIGCPSDIPVLEFINRIASFTGKGSKKRKQDYLSSFISRLSPLEAKCLVKTLLRDLRIGISTGILEEALAKKFNIPLDDLKKAHMIVGSLAYLLSHILKHGPSVIYHVQPVFFNPLKVMLADTAETPEEILKYHGGITSLEYKLDGIRVQIHKEGEQVKIFTRRLNEITSYLPEIVSQMREKRFNFITYFLNLKIGFKT